MNQSAFRHRLCFLFFLLALVRQAPAEELLAFPGAKGFGRFAKGGRGGRVIEVTNLKPRGPESLRTALEAKGPRIVVFRVGGTIDMARQTITISNPYLTIAGQTAPGDGIVLKRAQVILIATHDVIVRHLRVRPGPDVPVPYSSQTLTVVHDADRKAAHDVIVDHCSFSWATDDTAGAWGTKDVTYQWCIFSEGLNVKTQFQGKDVSLYGKGFIIGAGATRTSLLHNLFAHHADRTPQAGSGEIQFVNNVVYNVPGDANVYPANGAVVDIEFVSNHFIRGPNSKYAVSTAIRNIGTKWDGHVSQQSADKTRVYVKGNIHTTLRPDDSHPEDKVVYQGGGGLPIVKTPLGFPKIASQTDAFRAKRDVLERAGATVPTRSPVDLRVIDTVRNGTGSARLRNPSQVGGYPEIPLAKRPPDYDTDHDGMPNKWERTHGLDPNDPSDGPRTAANGYTNLENYLNELAGDPVPRKEQSP